METPKTAEEIKTVTKHYCGKCEQELKSRNGEIRKRSVSVATIGSARSNRQTSFVGANPTS